jgi:hypothetical protein
VFLGLINDTARLMYFIPEVKLTAVLVRIQDLMALKRAPIRDVASIYGQLSAFGPATGPAIRLLTRIGQRAFSGSAARAGWNGWMDVQGLRDELRDLVLLLPTINGFRFDQKELVKAVNMVVASDASDYGFGIIMVSCGDAETHAIHPSGCEASLVQKRLFSAREQALSSTHRELIALVAVYSNEALLRQWEGQSISHLTDNMGVSAIMRIGSPVASLHEMAVFIHRHCRAHNVLLRVHWRPRADPRMEAANARSRHFDVDDWGIDYQGYQEVLAFSSSKPVVDLFATEDNRKCGQFASKFAAEFFKAVGINAFSLN